MRRAVEKEKKRPQGRSEANPDQDSAAGGGPSPCCSRDGPHGDPGGRGSALVCSTLSLAVRPLLDEN